LSRPIIPVADADVEAVFASYPRAIATKLKLVRRLIFETAATMDGVGPVTEALKWGEPAYLTEQSGSGSTIRLGCPRGQTDRYAIYFNCRTSLVSTFREMFAEEFAFSGDRAILLDVAKPVPKKPLAICLGFALTYHRQKRAG
jgi:hypothetical protein